MSNIVDQLPEDIKSEFEVDEQGRVFAKGIRAVARLAGVTMSALSDGRLLTNGQPKGLLNKLSEVQASQLVECLQPFAGFDFKVTEKIPDTLIEGIVYYYAHESKASNDTAKRVHRAIAAVGLRTFLREQLGWNQQSTVPKCRPKQIEKWRKEGKSEEWIDVRIKGIESGRKPLVTEIFSRGGSVKTVAAATEIINKTVTGKTASEIKAESLVKQTREGLDELELAGIFFTEVLDRKRLQKFDCKGNEQILEQTEQAAIGVKMLMDDCS